MVFLLARHSPVAGLSTAKLVIHRALADANQKQNGFPLPREWRLLQRFSTDGL